MNESAAVIRRGNLYPVPRLAFRARGFIGGVVLLPSFVWVAFSQPRLPSGGWANHVVDAVGWLVFLGGVFFRFWPTLYVGGRKRVTIVREGPYSICRNPLYFGSFLVALSTGFFLQSALWLLFVGIVVLAYVYLIVPAEEADLRSIHGEPYEAYCREVPRFWPDFRLFQSPAEFTVRLKGLRIEARRAAIWIFLPLGCELLTWLRLQPFWPHWSISLW